jgi:glycosyltransferase involved in cell wall biosynthesis
MRVCMAATAFPRYAGDYRGSFVFELSRALVQHGLDITVLCPHDPNYNTAKEELIDGIQVQRFQYMWPWRAQRLCYGPGMPYNVKHGALHIRAQVLPYVLISALKVFTHHPVDLFHVHWPLPSGFGAWAASLLRNKPFVTTVYGGEAYIASHTGMTWLLRALLQRSSATVAISRATARALSESGAVSSPVEVIPLGVNTSVFHPPESRNGPGNDCPFHILAVGRLVERKGFEYLVKAMPAVLAKHPNTSLRIVGSGPNESSLRALIEENHLDRAVTLSGSVPYAEVPGLYRQADLFMLPAIVDAQGDTEGQGVVVLEAMASRVPVVATRVGGITDMIQSGENGFLVEPKHSTELAQAIQRLIEDTELRSRIAQNGYRAATGQYAWSQIAKRYVDIYARVEKQR